MEERDFRGALTFCGQAAAGRPQRRWGSGGGGDNDDDRGAKARKG